MTKKTRKLRKTKKLAALLQLALLGGSMLAGTRAAYATTIYYYSQNTAGQPINDPKSINELTVWEQHARINITYGETMAVAYCYDEAKLPSHKGWAYTDGGQIIIHDSQDVPWYLIGSFAKSDNSPGCPHDTATAQNGLVEYIAEGNVLSTLSQEHRDHFIGGYASANETAIAKNNTVNFGVTGAQCLGSVNSLYGGWAYWNNSGAAMSRSITAAGNTVNLQNTGADYSYPHTYPGIASAIDAAVFGGYAQQVYEFDDVTWDNKPLISTNTIAADGNTVNISGGRANGKAAGGAAEVSSLKDYTVTSNSTFKMRANTNAVNISGGILGANVYGGYVSADSFVQKAVIQAAADGNKVALKGGTINNAVYGGYVDLGGNTETKSIASASNNSVKLDGSIVNGDVYGGYTSNKSTTANNVIDYTRGSVSGTIYGGNGTSNAGNILNVRGSGFTAGNIANLAKVNLYLPSTVTTAARVLTLNGGSVTDLTGTEIQAMTNSDTILSVGDQITLLYNAAGVSGVKGGNTAAMVNSAAVGYDSVINVSATDSAVIGTVTKPTIAKIAPTADDTALNLLAADSTVKRAVAGSTYGAYSADGTASTGTVAYDGGSSAVGQNLYGAYTYGSHAAASKSQATLVSGTVDGSIIGGAAVSSDDTETSAVDNTVKLQSGTVRGNVYGGFAGHSAVGNTVDLNGAHVAGDVYGGYALHSVTTGNTINWTSGDVAGTVYGGNETDYTGNILNIYGNSLTAGNLANFATINYYLPDSTANGSTIVTLTGGGTTDLTGTTVTVNAEGVSSLAIGDTVTLLTTNGTLKTSDTTLSGTLTKGVSMDYALSLAANSNSLTMNVESGVLKPQTKSLAETRGGQAAFLNGGADFLAGTGMARATEAARSSDGKTVSEFAPFYGAGGSAMRANTGSYVDLKGQNMTLGLAREIKQASGRLLFGPVCEYGAGRYTSHLDDGTRGDGNTHYYGAGLFAREEQDNGCYYEGSLRMGHTTSDYRSYDLKGATSTRDGHVSYDTKTNYWGAHLGAGQVRKLANGDSLDLYGKYFYGRTGSTDTTLSSGETYHFDAVNSHRLHLGGRYTHVVNDQSSIYAGAAWQYEFGGDARASYKGFSTPAPSLKGSSGMLELGWQVKPSKSPVTIDLGLTGWVGRQQGVTFQAGAQWAF